jgi:hypothetical protein
MFVRVVTFTGATNVDGGVTFLAEKVAPLLRQQKGYRGMTASADRAGGVLGVLSVWETAADRDASDGVLAKTREEGRAVIGGELSVETFEQVFMDVAQPPGIGSGLCIRRSTIALAKIDENLDSFKRDIIPLLKEQPGYRAMRQLINRQTGEGMVGTVWADHAAAAASYAASAVVDTMDFSDRGVTVGEQSLREVVFIDLP